MRKLFNSQYKITQEYAARPDYYKQFGLKGHEGIDLIPTTSDFTVLSLEDGIVVKDDDVAGDPRTDAYGINVTIWHPSIKKATQYCHLKSNSLSNGETVKKGQKIGIMGASGNTSGAHVHLNLFEVDDNGVRLNKENGYLGGINPKPFLEESDEEMVTISKKEYEGLKSCPNDRDTNWNMLNFLFGLLKIELNPNDKEASKNRAGEAITDLQTKAVQVSSLEDQLRKKDEEREVAVNQAKTTLENQFNLDKETWSTERTALNKSIGQLNRRLEEKYYGLQKLPFREKVRILFGV